MQRKVKENLPPHPEFARKSRVPVPKAAEVKRKRRNASPTLGSSRPPVPKSPRSCGGKKTVRFIVGKNSQESLTPKTPLRTINRQFLTADGDQQDTEFETDEAALQSILNNTGIQTTPSFGHHARHTLATVNNQRNSIYAPPEKKDIHSFRRMCEEFAKGRAQSDAKKSQTVGQSTVHCSPGILPGGKAMRRMTTDNQFAPKRRCFENQWNQGSLSASKENVHSHRVTELHHKQNKDIGVHFKGDSLGVLPEEDTGELAQDKDETNSSVNKGSSSTTKDLSSGKRKPSRSFTADHTPQRVPKSDKLSICPSTDSIIRYYNNRESMPGRVLQEVDVFHGTAKNPAKSLVGVDDVGPGTPKELRRVEVNCLTPSRVLVQKKLSTDSPKVYSFAATPMRVLKHGRCKPDLQNKGCVQDSTRASISEQNLMKESSEMYTDTKSALTVMSNATIGEINPIGTESGIPKETIMSSNLKDFPEEPIGSMSDMIPKEVWTPKTTAAKTPVKQEILTIKVETSNDQGELTLDKTQGFDCYVTRNNHQRDNLESTKYTDTNQSRREWIRPMMQLPVVISPVDKPVLEPDEMPDSANTNWCRPKIGTLVPQNLKFDETQYDKGQERIEYSPAESCDTPSARQELLDRVQKHLERKLQRLDNTRSAASQLPSETEKTSDEHLNKQNNNLQASEDNFATGELIKTAGQFISHISQGIDYQTNANSHTPLDINCNVGTLAVNSSHPFNEAQSNTTHHPLTSFNVTLNMSHHEGSGIDKQGNICKSDVETERATILRKTNMNTKVVSPDLDVNIDVTRTLSGNKSPITDSLMTAARDEKIKVKPEIVSEAGIYAPTPRVIRRHETLEHSTEESDFKSTIPLMTPLALKMMAKRKKKATSTIYDDMATSSNSMQKPKFYHQTVKREESTVTENIEQHQAETLHKTPPPSKTSAFSAVKKSSLTPLVGSLSLRGNSGTKTRSHVRSCSRDRGLKGMLLSMNERYQEALLDDEVMRFAERLVIEQVGNLPRCTDPVAKILFEGDDMHFVPIEEESPSPSCSGYIPGSAFTKYQTLVG